MIKLSPDFKDSLSHRIVAILDFINRSLVISNLLFLLLFTLRFDVTLSLGFLSDNLRRRKVESKTIGDNDEAERKLFTEVEQVIGLLLRPISCGR
jgi:hypothetical protein